MRLNHLGFDILEWYSTLHAYFIAYELDDEGDTEESIMALPRNPLSGRSLVSMDDYTPDSEVFLDEGESWSIVDFGTYSGLTNDSGTLLEVYKDNKILGYLYIANEPIEIRQSHLDNPSSAGYDEDSIAKIKSQNLFNKYDLMIVHM